MKSSILLSVATTRAVATPSATPSVGLLFLVQIPSPDGSGLFAVDGFRGE